MNEQNKQTLLKDNKLRLVFPKKKYNRKRKYKTKNYKCKIWVKDSKQIIDVLKKRIKVEHTNSILHRSFKRLSVVYLVNENLLWIYRNCNNMYNITWQYEENLKS